MFLAFCKLMFFCSWKRGSRFVVYCFVSGTKTSKGKVCLTNIIFPLGHCK